MSKKVRTKNGDSFGTHVVHPVLEQSSLAVNEIMATKSHQTTATFTVDCEDDDDQPLVSTIKPAAIVSNVPVFNLIKVNIVYPNY